MRPIWLRDARLDVEPRLAVRLEVLRGDQVDPRAEKFSRRPRPSQQLHFPASCDGSALNSRDPGVRRSSIHYVAKL
jgi:hypothetical protein